MLELYGIIFRVDDCTECTGMQIVIDDFQEFSLYPNWNRFIDNPFYEVYGFDGFNPLIHYGQGELCLVISQIPGFDKLREIANSIMQEQQGRSPGDGIQILGTGVKDINNLHTILESFSQAMQSFSPDGKINPGAGPGCNPHMMKP